MPSPGAFSSRGIEAGRSSRRTGRSGRRGARSAAPAVAHAAWLLIALSSRARADEPLFREAGRELGISFVHENGARGGKYLPETMCGGAGWIDADGDGRLDLYLVNAHDDARKAAGKGRPGNALYLQRPDGTFEDATEEGGVGDGGYGFGLAVGDIENDGDSDLYVTNFGANVLYLNRGDGTFEDVTEESGTACPLWSASAAFCDVDSDGLLDLYVANYLLYDPRIHKACTGNATQEPSYCHPNKYDGAPDRLYLNLGGGRFRDISEEAGIAVTGRILSKGLGVLPTDFDLDGDIDLFVANDSVPNFLWRNLGDGRFQDAALEAGVSLNTNGAPEACMGIDGADLNADGWPDYFITNFSQETDSLFLSEGGGFYLDGTARSGLGRFTYLPLGFGTRFIDADLDGDLDIFATRGHILDNVERLHPKGDVLYRQSDQLFMNDGRARFTDASASGGAWFAERRVGRGVAFADVESDGDLDLLVVNLTERPALLLGQASDRALGSWVGIDLVGDGPSNRDAYGARVAVHTADGTRTFERRSAASYLAANDPRILCGLGRTSSPVTATVRWPDGLEETFTDLAPGRYHRLMRGRGEPSS